MATEPVRVGIIGGSAGAAREDWGVRAHLPALMALPEIDVVAVCTRHIASAEDTARHFGIARAFDRPEAMVACDDVEVIDVCVNVGAHHELASLAVDAGKNVFCEWPLGQTLAESRRMSDQAAKAGVNHMVGLQARSAPVYDYMRSLVAGGYVGDVLSCSVNGSMGIEPSPRVPMLALIHFGHCMDTLLHVVDDDVDDTSSLVSTAEGANHIVVNGRLRGGGVLALNIRHIPVFATGFTLEINGTQGTLAASIDGSVLAVRGVRSLGEQINQATLRGGRKGQPVAEMTIPPEHRWVPDNVPSGPPLSVAQVWRRFAEAIRASRPAEPDFALAVRRHELFERFQRDSS